MRRGNRTLLRMAALTLALLMLAGCGGEGAPKTTAPAGTETEPLILPMYPPEEVPTEPGTEPPVQIAMGEYELSYSGTLKDVIRYQELTEGSGGLAFTVVLSGGEEPIFTMYYNSDQGDYVTVLQDAGGNRIPVAFAMAQIPEDLSEEDEYLFFSAQEAVNEIVMSLTLK